ESSTQSPQHRCCDLAARAHTQPVADTLDVTFGSAFRDEEPICDLTVRHAGRNQLRNLLFASAQRAGVDCRFRFAVTKCILDRLIEAHCPAFRPCFFTPGAPNSPSRSSLGRFGLPAQPRI